MRIAGRARFNAPDLKSDVRSNVPGVRIPRYPPYSRNPHIAAGFLLLKNKYVSLEYTLFKRSLFV